MEGRISAPAHHHQLLLCCLPAEALPHVDGEQGAAAVEDGGERAHEGRHDHGNHQAPQTWGEVSGSDGWPGKCSVRTTETAPVSEPGVWGGDVIGKLLVRFPSRTDMQSGDPQHQSPGYGQVLLLQGLVALGDSSAVPELWSPYAYHKVCGRPRDL